MNTVLLLALAVLIAVLNQTRRIELPTRTQKCILTGTTMVATALGAVVAFGGVV